VTRKKINRCVGEAQKLLLKKTKWNLVEIYDVVRHKKGRTSKIRGYIWGYNSLHERENESSIKHI
jgi:hypothetical protein